MFSNHSDQTAFGLKLRDLIILATGLLLGMGLLAADLGSIYVRIILGAGVILSALVLALWKEAGSGDALEQVLLKRLIHRSKPRRLVRGGGPGTTAERLPGSSLTRSELARQESPASAGPAQAPTVADQTPESVIYSPIIYVRAPLKNEGLITFSVVCFVMVTLLVAIWRYELFESAIAALRLIGR
jgi:hypothetical protein